MRVRLEFKDNTATQIRIRSWSDLESYSLKEIKRITFL